MNERLFATLAARLHAAPVVMASVIDARGATPRSTGSRMLIGTAFTAFSVGGGMAEARVIKVARTLLHSYQEKAEIEIDLSGRQGADGICGGAMVVRLKRFMPHEQALVEAQAQALARGARARLDGEPFEPNERLLIIGAGHCGSALAELARPLDFEIRFFDDEPGRLHAWAHDAPPEKIASLDAAFSTEREVYVVLLNRDFAADVLALRALKEHCPSFIGMMGSRKRIQAVSMALNDSPDLLARLVAPVGLDIQAETPHEIAISILAQLIKRRRADR